MKKVTPMNNLLPWASLKAFTFLIALFPLHQHSLKRVTLMTDGFFAPFQFSAEYLGMVYLGNLHTWIENVNPSKEVVDGVKEFVRERLIEI